jgi:hypothetical protein
MHSSAADRAHFPGSSFGRSLASQPGSSALACLSRGLACDGRWCACLGLVYDLWTAALFSPLPCTRRQKPPPVTATGR